jgi:phosphoserine phosphatase RsbU/P
MTGQSSTPQPVERPSAVGFTNAELARIRHDLRTPINHILGYCEMLLEEENLPESFTKDLRRILGGGSQLLALLKRLFDEDTAEIGTLDLHQLSHELRTPVNHIIGYSEILQEQAEELHRAELLPDFRRIHSAANTWLGLMEQYLLPATAAKPAEAPKLAAIDETPLAPRPKRQTFTGRLLVVDDDEANCELLARRLRREGFDVTVARESNAALELLRSEPFDLALLDVIMPGLDGYGLLKVLKSEPRLREIPVLMISALDHDERIARCIEQGADDYLAKPFNPVILRARINASLEKKRLRESEQQTLHALQESQAKLASELSEAAEYVRSLLPSRMEGAIAADWRFVPSTELGGDVLNYEWIDERHFAVFVLDVCGHGLSAAFFSISVLNMLRTRALPGADLRDPAAVLHALNERFPMERQNNMYFTLWYGVFDKDSRQLRYATAGHPPALLLSGSGDARRCDLLRTNGMLVGYDPSATYSNATCDVPLGAKLFVFSDGAYEIARPDGTMLKFEEFVAHVCSQAGDVSEAVESAVAWARAAHGAEGLDDDVSIVALGF